MASRIVAAPTGLSVRVRMLLLGLALAACCGPLTAQTDAELTEDRIKAAFLFKFGEYVEWPPETYAAANAPFMIGVLGADQVAAELAVIVANRQMDGRNAAVRKLGPEDSIEGVQVLFVGRSESDRLGTLLAAMPQEPVLIVTEVEQLPVDGIINFVIVNNKVRFDVALSPAHARNLKISSRLLGVARSVVNGSS